MKSLDTIQDQQSPGRKTKPLQTVSSQVLRRISGGVEIHLTASLLNHNLDEANSNQTAGGLGAFKGIGHVFKSR